MCVNKHFGGIGIGIGTGGDERQAGVAEKVYCECLTPVPSCELGYMGRSGFELPRSGASQGCQPDGNLIDGLRL